MSLGLESLATVHGFPSFRWYKPNEALKVDTPACAARAGRFRFSPNYASQQWFSQLFAEAYLAEKKLEFWTLPFARCDNIAPKHVFWAIDIDVIANAELVAHGHERGYWCASGVALQFN